MITLIMMILSGFPDEGLDPGYATALQALDLCIMAGIAMVVFS